MLGTIGEQIKAGIASAFAEIKASLTGGAQSTAAAAATTPADGVITEEIRAEIRALLEPVTKDLAKAQADLAGANKTITERDGTIAQLQKEKGELEARLKDPKGEAGKQSAQILAGLHVQPVKTGADAGAGGQQDSPQALLEQYQAITDYRERGAFYEKHKDRLLQATPGKLTLAK